MTIWKSTNCLIESFDDEAIVYNSLSGETHELNLLAVDALQLLSTPYSIAQLTEQISQIYQIPSDSQLTSQLQRLVDEFVDLGLVEEASA